MNVKKVMSLAVAVSMATMAFAQSTAMAPRTARIVTKADFSKIIEQKIVEKNFYSAKQKQDKEATQKRNTNAPKTNDKNIQGEPTSRGNDVAGKEEPTNNEIEEKTIAPKTNDKNIQGEPTSKGNEVAGKEEPTDNEIEEKTIEKTQPVTNEDDNAIGQDGINDDGDTFNPSRERNNDKKINARDLKGDDNGAAKGEPTPLDERAVADSVTNAVTNAGAVMSNGVKGARDILEGVVKGLVAKGLSFDDFE